MDALEAAGHEILIPEIADYEVRRELVRVGATAGLRRLDDLAIRYRLIELDRAAMLLAADLWAGLRNRGLPTASADALDGDVILLAQAIRKVAARATVVVATVNANHLGRITGVVARRWEDLDPARIAASVPS